jgi:hypothetical protein
MFTPFIVMCCCVLSQAAIDGDGLNNRWIINRFYVLSQTEG